MSKIDYVSKLVYRILEEDVKARDDDVYLYLKVCEHFDAEALKVPFGQVLSSLRDYNLPPFETVRRARQKNQEHHPELSASEEVKKAREKKKKEYRDYAINGV
jgi:hypothetical protein